MIDLFHYIIEEGKIFGIACVSVIIITSGITKVLKSQKYGDKVLLSLLNFLRLFAIMAICFALIVFIFEAATQLNDPRNEITHPTSPGTIEPAVKASTDVTIKISAGLWVTFSKAGSFIAVRKTWNLGQHRIKIDTIINEPISSIKEFRVYEMEQRLRIYYNNELPSESLVFDTNHNNGPFNNYIHNLQRSNYPIRISYPLASLLTILALSLLLAAFICGFFANFNNGCLIFWIALGLMVAGIILLAIDSI